MNEVPRSSRLPKTPVPWSREIVAGNWPKVAGKSSSSRTGFWISLGLHGCLAAAACSLVWLPAAGNGSGGVSAEGEAGEIVMGVMPDAAESSAASPTSIPKAMPMPVLQVPVFSNHVDLPPPERWTTNVTAPTPPPTTVAAATAPTDRAGIPNPRLSPGKSSSAKGSGKSRAAGQAGGGNSSAQKQPSGGPPKLVYAPPPRYPATAKSAGKSGQVRVLIQVRGNGSAASASLYHGSGDPALDSAAVAAARSWKFTATPSLGNGQTIPVVVKVNFRL